MWINKFIAHTGFCSRREADKLVEEGKVKINGDLAQKTQHVYETDVVEIDGQAIEAPKKHRIYIALNKPAGIVCTTETEIPHNIIEFVGHDARIFPIGRLDRESAGLILLTNDGDIVSRFTDEVYGVEKEYYVRLDQNVTWELVNGLLEGVTIDEKLVKAKQVKRVSPRAVKVVITQEMRRQIRRMFAHLGFRVYKLERIRIAHINVRDLPPGDWRYLTKTEVIRMFNDLKYHPAQKWLKPGEEFVFNFTEPRPFEEQQNNYQDRPQGGGFNNNRPYNNRNQGQGGGGGYNNRNQGGGGGGYNNNNRPYDNRNQGGGGGGYNNNNRPYDNRNQGGGGGYNNNNRPYDNRNQGGGGYGNNPYENRPPFDPNRQDMPPMNENRGYDNRPNDNRYENRYDSRRNTYDPNRPVPPIRQPFAPENSNPADLDKDRPVRERKPFDPDKIRQVRNDGKDNEGFQEKDLNIDDL
jgi:23S rRNA pseudouridine2604 synthase